MKTVKIDRQWLMAIAVFGVLFAATYKNTADIVETSKFFIDVNVPVYLSAIQSVSAIFFVLPILCAATGLIFKGGRPVIGKLTATIALLVVYLVFRLMGNDTDQAVKITSASAIFALFVPLAMIVQGEGSAISVPRSIEGGFFIFVTFHSLFNLALLLMGEMSHGGRFLGTSVHANFIGVQMALACLIFLCRITLHGVKRPWYHLFALIAFAILLASGSRTGLFVLASGIGVYFLLQGMSPLLAAALAFAITISGIVFFLSTGIDVTLDQYDRGGINTRAEAWLYLWNIIDANPLVGVGYLPIKSESSYLRGWAAVGIPYVAIMLLFLGLIIISAVSYHIKNRKIPEISLMYAIVVGMLCGAFFENYLLDTLSFQIYVFLLAVLALDASVIGQWRPKFMRPNPVGGAR